MDCAWLLPRPVKVKQSGRHITLSVVMHDNATTHTRTILNRVLFVVFEQLYLLIIYYILILITFLHSLVA